MGKRHQNTERFVGVARLFDAVQLKSFFLNYLYFIVAIEILIFLVSFVGNMGPEKGTFPWKLFFYAAFIIPVACTFLLGIFILAFNKFFFGINPADEEIGGSPMDEEEPKNHFLKLSAYLTNMRQVPFLPILFLIVTGSMLLYKMDDIFLFIINAGEKALSYILIGAAVLLGIAILLWLLWLLVNYRLNRQQMQYEYKYKNDVMDKLGLLILDDNTVIDRKGKIISQPESLVYEGEETGKGTLKILPPSN